MSDFVICLFLHIYFVPVGMMYPLSFWQLFDVIDPIKQKHLQVKHLLNLVVYSL